MSTLEQAIEIASRAHRGQQDRRGEPYLLHPLRVMMGVDGLTAKIVAALHDVVEDTDVTLDQLRSEGFDQEVIEALDRITHREDQSYAEYSVECSRNPIARQVKLADLRDNAALQRLLLRPDQFAKDSKRMHRYVLTYRFLTDELSEEQYCELMSDFEKVQSAQ